MSNQEGEWLKNDSEVQQMLRKSDIYMIGQRREAKFVWAEDTPVKPGMFGGQGVQFKFEIPDIASADVELSIEKDFKHESLLYEAGDKFVRCSLEPEHGELGDVIGDVVCQQTLRRRSISFSSRSTTKLNLNRFLRERTVSSGLV
jgi:hypothetical protein